MPVLKACVFKAGSAPAKLRAWLALGRCSPFLHSSQCLRLESNQLRTVLQTVALATQAWWVVFASWCVGLPIVQEARAFPLPDARATPAALPLPPATSGSTIREFVTPAGFEPSVNPLKGGYPAFR